MKKKIISIVVLLIFLSAGFIYLNRVFSSIHYYVNSTEDFKDLAKKTNIDVIIYGSSHAYTAYNPLIINDVCKTISFNLGSDGLKMPITDIVLEESLKFTKPKLIILEIYPPTITPIETDADKGYHLRAMDFVSNFSANKLKKTMRVFNKNEYLGVYFPLIRNHSNWNDYNFLNLSRKRYIDNRENFYYGGFLGSRNVLNEEDSTKYMNFKTAPKRLEPTGKLINKQSKIDIESFVNLAKKVGSEVLVISSPDPRATISFNYSFFEELDNYCKSLNIDFLNLNDYYDQMDLNIDDFKDNSHLNTFGSIKATQFLAQYLKKNYELPNRTSEIIWKEEMKVYEDLKYDYYEFEKKYFRNTINKNLSKDVFVSNVSVLQESKKKLLFNIALDSNKTNSNNLENYILAVHLYPENKDASSLSEASKAKNKEYDQANIHLRNQESLMDFDVETEIRDIKKIEIFLFSSEGYDGVIGNKIIIKDISFKK
ncbi:hypothetical protein [Bizionia paragorgiae]|uniref:hypothetical protein n=1 Tax=Bizionia paragorgiae TaxID=283786 RepID=UPI003A9182F5